MSNVKASYSHDIPSLQLKQNPHKPNRDPRGNNLEIAIGREVKALRKQKSITVTELSKRTGISPGMLSKIENGLTSPSLSTLQTLATTLSVSLTSLLRDYEEHRAAVHVKAGEGLNVERAGTRSGHQYRLLGHIGDNNSGVIVEPYLIELTDQSDTFADFEHDGIEFIYMIEGEIEYFHTHNSYLLQPGDSLTFDATSPHGPKNLIKLPARFLSVITYLQAK